MWGIILYEGGNNFTAIPMPELLNQLRCSQVSQLNGNYAP